MCLTATSQGLQHRDPLKSERGRVALGMFTELVATRQSETLLLVTSQIKFASDTKARKLKSRVIAQRAQITILIVHEAAVGQLRLPTGLAS